MSSVHLEKVIHTYDHNKVMWQSAQQEKYAAYAKNLFCVLKLFKFFTLYYYSLCEKRCIRIYFSLLHVIDDLVDNKSIHQSIWWTLIPSSHAFSVVVVQPLVQLNLAIGGTGTHKLSWYFSRSFTMCIMKLFPSWCSLPLTICSTLLRSSWLILSQSLILVFHEKC